MLINEKDVVKNVDMCTANGKRFGTPSLATAVGVFTSMAIVFAGLFAGLPTGAHARQSSGLGNPVQLSSLPSEAQQTEQRILAGGPFPYSRDGVVFGNYEKRLERHPRGYYHEYTVPTPGARTRGARRIICGGAKLTEPDACFYTEDHYNSFHRIVK